MDALSLLVGGVSGGLLGGVAPAIAGWIRKSKLDGEELREFIGFIKEETEARAAGRGEGYWWNPLPHEVQKYSILARLVQKGLLIYRPGNGFTLKDHP